MGGADPSQMVQIQEQLNLVICSLQSHARLHLLPQS